MDLTPDDHSRIIKNVDVYSLKEKLKLKKFQKKYLHYWIEELIMARILYVEDNDDNIYMLKDIVEKVTRS